MSPVIADRVAPVTTEARGTPAISEFGIYDTTNASAANHFTVKIADVRGSPSLLAIEVS